MKIISVDWCPPKFYEDGFFYSVNAIQTLTF